LNETPGVVVVTVGEIVELELIVVKLPAPPVMEFAPMFMGPVVDKSVPEVGSTSDVGAVMLRASEKAPTVAMGPASVRVLLFKFLMPVPPE
jgi:hypothetical protein